VLVSLDRVARLMVIVIEKDTAINVTGLSHFGRTPNPVAANTIIANVTPILIGKICHLQILSNDIVGQIVIFLVYSYAGFLRWGDHQ